MALREARNYRKSHDFADNLLPYLFMHCFTVQRGCIKLQTGKPRLNRAAYVLQNKGAV